jgi:RNA polymerase sigma-70 factor (ECF subfamily)
MSEPILPRRPAAGRPRGDLESDEPCACRLASEAPAQGRQPASAELVARMASGERAAVEQLYDRYAALVYTLARRILGRPADAEEVTQEVFLQAWRDAGRFDSARGTPRTWLVTLARARAIDALRAANRGVRRAEVALAWDAPDPQPNGAEGIGDRQIVIGAISRLSAQQREVLELAYYQGMTQTEIAARTGLPLGTVKTRVRSALERLRVICPSSDSP